MAELLLIFVMWIGAGSDPLWVKRPASPNELIGLTREQVIDKLGPCYGSAKGNREVHGGIGNLIGMYYNQFGIGLYFEDGKVKQAYQLPKPVAPMPRQIAPQLGMTRDRVEEVLGEPVAGSCRWSETG
jgi:hypothetical protein